MDNEIPEINELIKQFSKLPGLGPKSAKRIILKLINNKDNMVKPLAKSLAEVYKKVVRCADCGNLKIIVSARRSHHFHSCKGSPETQQSSQKRLRQTTRKNKQKNTKNTENGLPKGPLWAAKRRPTNNVFHILFDTAPLGVPRGPQVTKRLPKTQQ